MVEPFIYTLLFCSGYFTRWGVKSLIKLKQKYKQKDRKQIIQNSINNNLESSQKGLDLQDEVICEQLTRNTQFFGPKGQTCISKAFVIVIGLGGVGSHAALHLLRSGVRKLRLIDFDQVSLSSLNRHAVATREDVGSSKTECIKQHFYKIFPEVEVEVINEMFTDKNAERLLSDRPDYVIDSIDNIDTKVHLIHFCLKNKIKVLMVAGAGAKCDPSKIRICDISLCQIDPLARTVRKRLKKLCGVSKGIDVVVSIEKPRVGLVSSEEMQSGNIQDYQVVPNFRVRSIPVLGTSPALFGIASASYVACILAQKPILHMEPVIYLARQQYEIQYRRLLEREELKYGHTQDVFVDLDDVYYLVRYVWRGVSARKLGSMDKAKFRGLNINTDDLVLTRWRQDQEATLNNLVLLTFEEADELEQQSFENLQQSNQEFVQFIDDKLKSI